MYWNEYGRNPCGFPWHHWADGKIRESSKLLSGFFGSEGGTERLGDGIP
jgi:hypothetical protein